MQGDGEQKFSWFITLKSLTLLPPHALPLHQPGVTLMGCSPSCSDPTWASYRLQFNNRSNTAPFQGAVLQEGTASAWIPHGSQYLTDNLLHPGPPFLPRACSCLGSQQIAASLNHTDLLQHSLQLQCVLPINLCSGAWNPSCPPPALTLVSTGLLLSHFPHSCLSQMSHSTFDSFLSMLPQRHN